jgi:histidinol phosphatase-like enzyme (inositol monophosphatase family)
MTAPVDMNAFLDQLADISGAAILPFFRTAIAANDKSRGGVFDPVTEADRASEASMRQLIKRQFPAHGIVGEEYGAENENAEFCWVLDPIDGTKAFISGLPVWGTLIGLLQNGRPVLGMMNQPFTRERFWGDGGQARWRGATGERTLKTRPCASLAEATIMTTSPSLFPADALRQYQAVERETRLARYGCDCYAYCVLAAGHIDAVIEAGLKPHDVVALVPIIEGAGGVITTWDGGPAAQGGAIVASGDPRLHDVILEKLAKG